MNYFPLFVAGIGTQNPGLFLPTHSALQPAEHIPERYDRSKIKSTASHFLQTRRNPFSMSSFPGVKRPEREVCQKLYSKTCLKRTPYIAETWTNGK